jgi:inorganic pyrophosphatase
VVVAGATFRADLSLAELRSGVGQAMGDTLQGGRQTGLVVVLPPDAADPTAALEGDAGWLTWRDLGVLALDLAEESDELRAEQVHRLVGDLQDRFPGVDRRGGGPPPTADTAPPLRGAAAGRGDPMSAADGENEFVVIVEVPMGSRNKYEIDHETGEIFLDRRLFTATRYPVDYGFFPETLAKDGDPLDALVLLTDPTFPGCRVRVRVIGAVGMTDESGEDAKVLCAALKDQTYGSFRSVDDLEPPYRAEIEHFFAVYKDLQPGAHSTVGEWSGVDAALALIDDARRRARSEA